MREPAVLLRFSCTWGGYLRCAVALQSVRLQCVTVVLALTHITQELPVIASAYYQEVLLRDILVYYEV